MLSSTTFDIAPDVASPDTIVDLVIFLSPPPEVSTAKNTSSPATVDISDNDPTAIELKFVPSATNKLPAVFVPIVISSPDTVRSPVTTSNQDIIDVASDKLYKVNTILIADGTNFNSVAVGSLSEISSVANDDVLLAVDTSGGGLKKIARSTLVSGLATSGAISNVVEDTSPQLGGSLDVNGEDIVSVSNGNITLTPNGTGVVRIDGSNGIDMQSGAISIKNSGAQSYVRFYCESSNAHYAQLQAPAHSDFSGNITLTLPATTDTVAGIAATQTFTNKTLTSPKINENVAVTATATEINLLDGDTARGTTSVSDTDGIIHNDAGTMRMTSAQTFKAYVNSGLTLAADNLTIGDAAVTLSTLSGDITIDATANDTDIIFKGTDNSSDITMLTLDGSEAGEATFNAGIVIADAGNIGSASDKDAIAIASNGVVTFSQTPVNSAGAAFVTDDPTALAIALG